MTSVDGGGELPVLLALLTKPEQPLKNAAEQLRITALTAHTHPLALIFTFIAFSGLRQLFSCGEGLGPAEMAARSCLIYVRRIEGRPVSLLLARRTDLVQGSKHNRHGAHTGLQPGTIWPIERVRKGNPGARSLPWNRSHCACRRSSNRKIKLRRASTSELE